MLSQYQPHVHSLPIFPKMLKMPRISVNVAFRRDPTRTLSLRNQFSAQMKSRFKKLKALIQTSIVENDCFGLNIQWAQGSFNPFTRNEFTILGGPGSGHFGHAGRPGKVGGSAAGGAARFGSLDMMHSNITKEEQESIDYWANGIGGCTSMRKADKLGDAYLSTRGRSEAQELSAHMNNFRNIVEKAPLHPGLKYRGITWLDSETLKKYTTIGNEITWDAMSAFTDDPVIAARFGGGRDGVIFKLNKPLPDISVSEVHIKQKVKEFIDLKNSKYVITKVESMKIGSKDETLVSLSTNTPIVNSTITPELLDSSLLKEWGARFMDYSDEFSTCTAAVIGGRKNLNTNQLTINQALTDQVFAFERDPAKVTKFMEWLQEQVNNEILETIPGQQLGQAVEAAWTNTYIQTAYQKGMLRGRQELKGNSITGYQDIPPYGSQYGSLQKAFNSPFHADKVGLIYTRSYEGLKGITNEMSKQISGILAQGISEGWNPKKIAEGLTDRVDKIGITRATILARTEVIRAHHVAMVQEYKNWGVTGVIVQAEWTTAGDNRVCPVCSSLQGKVYTLEQIEPLIPKHPQCRCLALPVDVTDEAPVKIPKEKVLEPFNFITAGNPTADFVQEIKGYADKLPAGVQEFFKTNPINVSIDWKLINARPDLAGQTPRGWPAGWTWEMVSGMHDQGTVHIAQWHLNPYNPTTWRSNTSTAKTFYHEVGHGFDQKLGDISLSTSFTEARQLDLNVLSSKINTTADGKLDYFLQPGMAGQQETFAEIIAFLMGESANNMGYYFPNFTEKVKQYFK